MRTLSLATIQALTAQETGEAFFYLIDISHPDIVTKRFVNNKSEIIAHGETYTPYAFDITIPDEDEGAIQRVRLRIDNIDREIVLAVRQISTPATFTIRVIREAEPNVDIAGPYDCTLRNVSYDALFVSGDLWPFEDISLEPYPQHVFDPAHFPALFRS